MASGESNLEFRVSVQGLNEFGQLRSQLMTLKNGTVQFKNAAMHLSQAIPKLEGSAKDLSRIYFGQATTLKTLVRNNKIFRNEVRSQIGLLKEARKETHRGSAAWKLYNKEIVLTRKEMKKIPLQKLGTDLRNVSQLLLKRGKDIQWVGRQMMVGITAPLMLMLRSSMQVFEAFEKQFVRTVKILGLGETASQSLRKDMSELSITMGASRSIVAGLTSDFAQMGEKMLGGSGKIQDVALEYTELALQLEHVGQVTAAVGRDFIANLAGIIDSEIPKRINEFGVEVIKTGDKIDYVRGLLAKFNLVENTTALSLKDLAEAFPQVSPAAVAAGVDLVFLSGVIGGMKQVGLNATESAHALKFALQRIVNPTTKVAKLAAEYNEELGSKFHQNLGMGNMMLFKLSENLETISEASEDGKKKALVYLGELVGKRQASRIYAASLALGSFAENVGKVGEVFTDAFGSDIGEAIAKTTDTDQLREQIKNVFATDESIEQYLQGIRDTQAETGKFGDKITDTSSNAEVFAASLGSLSPPMKALVIDYMGATAAGQRWLEEFGDVMKGPAMQMQLLRNRVKETMIEIGAAFFDTIKGLLDDINKWIEAIKNMDPQIKKMIIMVGGLVAAIGPLAFIFGQLTNVVGTTGRAAAAFLPKMQALTKSMLIAKALAGEKLPLLRRIGPGWVKVGKGAKEAGGLIRGSGAAILASFKALRQDPGIFMSGFMEAIRVNKNIVGSAKGTVMTVAQITAALPKTIDEVWALTSATTVQKGGMINKFLDDSRSSMNRYKGRMKSLKGSIENFASGLASKGRAVKKFNEGLAPVRIPSRAFPTAKGMPAAPSTTAQMGAGPSIEKMKKSLDSVKTRAGNVGRGMIKPFKHAGKQMALLVKHPMLTTFGLIKLQGRLTAMSFATAWKISMKAVKIAMMGTGILAVMVIIAAAITFIIQNLGRFKTAAAGPFKVLKQAWNNIKATFQEIGAMFFSLFDDLFGNKSKEGGEAVAESMSGVTNVLNGVATVVLKLSRVFRWVMLTVIPPIMKGVLLVIKGVSVVIGKILGWLGDNWKTLAKIVIEVVYWIVKILEYLLDTVLIIVMAIAKIVQFLAKPFFWVVNNVIVPVIQVAMSVIDKLLEVVLYVVQGIVNAFLWAANKIKPLINKILEGVSLVGQGLSWLTGGLIGGSVDWRLDDEIENLNAGANEFFDTIQSGRESVNEWVQGDSLKNAGEAVADAIDTSLDATVGALKKVVGADLARTTRSALTGLIEGSGIGSELDAVVTDALDPKVKDTIEDQFSDLDASDVGKEVEDEVRKAFQKAAATWIGKVRSEFQAMMKKIADNATKAFDAFSKVYLAAFDTRIQAIRDQQKAEKELTQTIAYENERRSLINRMALDKENFIRNRSLALYEGRIEDARSLTVKFKMSDDQSKSDIGKLDEDRSKALLEMKRKDAIEEVKIAKAAAADRIKIEREAFVEWLTERQKHLPKSKEDFEKYVTEVNDMMRTGMANAFGEESAAATSLAEFAEIVDKNLTEQFGELFSEAGVLDTGVTNITGSLENAVADWEETFQDFSTVTETEWKDIFDKVNAEWIEAIEWDRIAMGWADQFMDAAIPGMLAALEALKGNVQESMDDVGDVMGTALDGLSDNVEVTSTEIEDNLHNVAVAIKETADALDIMGADRKFFDPASYVRNQTYTSQANEFGGPPSTLAKNLVSESTRIPGGFETNTRSYYAQALSDSERDREEIVQKTNYSPVDHRQGGTNVSYYFDKGKWHMGPKPVDYSGYDTWGASQFFGGKIRAAYGRYVGGFQSAMVPIQAHGGEYIMSAKAVQNIGLSKLESMNHSRNYQGGGGSGTNIFVENFIGEPEWFEGMMSDYNVSVAPKNERSRGLESRKISSMADNNKRGRV